MTTVNERVIHQWEQMREYLIGQGDVMTWMEDGIEGKVSVIRKLPPNYYVYISQQNGPNAIRGFNSIIEELKRQGLDIGRGESMYGYKMPLPNEGDSQRKMMIFRRKLYWVKD